MPRWARSLVPPLLGGLLGGAITFGLLSVAAITYFGLLHQFQTLVSGILAIVASLVILFGVYARISHDLRVEQDKVKRDAFAFATALLRQAEEFQSSISLVYWSCSSSMQHGLYRYALEQLPTQIRDVTTPTLFEAPWRDLGLLNQDITLFIYAIKRSFEIAKNTATADQLLAMQPLIPGLLNPFSAAIDEPENKRWEGEAEKFLRDQVDFYESTIKAPLQVLINYLEAEAEEYAIQLGLEEKRKWLRALAKARRDARRQSGN